MKTSQRTLITAALVVILCALFVAGISAAPAAPNGPVTINKAVSPQIIEPTYTGVLTYTITLTNDYTETVENAIMTDTLPTALSFGGWVTQNGAINVGDTITWTGRITAETSLDFVFTAQVPGPETLQGLIDEGIVNTAYLGHLDGTVILPGSISDSATTRFYRYLFLPLVMRNFAQ
ncbi:MAG TPA: hypothetical protein PLH19_02130 [Anaerolineae bacterium]|nr:hypothetical protein [Anaerolineae bacterium]HQH37321.1 hypothetical protein [Anaerolineae bacterium]